MKTNFDDILKRKLEQQHFPVDQNHRAEMIDLLNNQNTRKPFPFWWLGGLVLVITIAGVYFSTLSNTVEQETKEQNSNELQITAPVAKDVIADAQTDKKVITDGVSENAIQHKSENTQEQPAEIHVAKQPKQKISIQLDDNSPVLNPETKSNQNLNQISNSKVNVNELDQETEIEEVNSQKVSHRELALTSEEKQNEIAVENELEENINLFASEIVDEEIIEEAFEARVDISISALAPVDLTGISSTSELMATQIKPSSFKKSFFFFGETCLGLVLGSQPDFEAGWKLRLGAGLGYSLLPKIQITLAGGYLYQNGGFDFQRMSSVNQPGFGARSSFNSLTPDKLHFIYSKLGIQARARRHVFAAHAGMQMLYGGQGDITTIVEDQFASGSVEMNQYAWLKTDGLRKLNWTADLSYGYQLTPLLSISAGADYYFSSFTVEDASLKQEGFTWSGAYSPFQPFININYMLYGRL